MSAYDNNPLPELIELCLRVGSAVDSGHHDVKTDLRVHPQSVDGEDEISFEVRIKKLTLDMELNGLAVIPGSRFGEPTKPNVETREQTVLVERTKESNASGEAELNSSLVFTGKGGASRKVAIKETVSHSEGQTHHRVRAVGNLKWDVTQPPWEDETLNLKALDDTAICRVQALDRANQKSVTLKAVVKQKDMTLDVSKKGFPFFRNANQKKLMGVLVSKALAFEGNYNGTVTFSESAFEIED